MKAILFDLDGTLIDSLPDIRDAVNKTCEDLKLPLHYDLASAKGLIGNGADALIHRALQGFDSPALFERFKSVYMPYYRAYQKHSTKFFPGMSETLQRLTQKGISLFVVTNKPDLLAQEIVAAALPPVFLEVRGQLPGQKPKPDPTEIRFLQEQYNLDLKNTVYVGDSLVDVQTAENAGLPSALCLWGYGSYSPDLLKRAIYLLQKPQDLLSFFS